MKDVSLIFYVDIIRCNIFEYESLNGNTIDIWTNWLSDHLKWRLVTTKGMKLCNIIPHHVIWTNQKTCFSVYGWQCPHAVISYAIWDTEGQLFDCSKLPYEITVLLPDLLKKKEEIYSFCKYVNKKLFQFYNYDVKFAWEAVETIDRSTVQGQYSMTSQRAWETVETIDRSTVRFCGPF